MARLKLIPGKLYKLISNIPGYYLFRKEEGGLPFIFRPCDYETLLYIEKKYNRTEKKWNYWFLDPNGEKWAFKKPALFDFLERIE